jgi:oligoendopeptidase F
MADLEQTERGGAADDVAWDLEPLVGGEGAEGVKRLLDEADHLADSLATKARGRLEEVTGPEFSQLIAESVTISELINRAHAYAALRFSTDTSDPERGALMALVQERGTAIATKLLFLELEWTALSDERADQLLSDDGLERARHHLTTLRAHRPHLLTEPEEKILAEKSVTGKGAWSRLFSELVSSIEVTVGDEDPAALDSALSRLASADRSERKAVATAVTEALEPGLRTRAYLFNTLLADKAADDRLRSYPSWVSSRNLSNEASDESVQALVSAVRARYDIPQRWYKLKAGLLGIDRLADYDRAAALGGEDPEFSWDEGCSIVFDSYEEFSPELGELTRAFLSENRIDAPVRPGKRGGAFCASVTPEFGPYVMLNWTSRRRDVLTLAHELGHGVHGALARKRGILEMSTPLTVAETASVFGEELVFSRLLDAESDPSARLSLLAESLEGAIATVFRQTAMNRFEELVHTERRQSGEISVERFGELWAESQEEMFGDSVEVTEEYRSWWSYIPHFIGTPGYVYAYAYGQLLALSVFAQWKREGDPFVPKYLEMLACGGSRSPEQIAAIGGLDLSDPGFWDRGLDLIEDRLGEAEAAASAA